MARIGAKKPLIVTDKFLRSNGTLDRITSQLSAKGMSFEIFDDTIPDPTVEVIGHGAKVFTKGSFDSMIALGGGSPIDTAKAIGILAVNGGKMRQYKVPNPIPKPGPPLVAIPTTAGTGSEVTKFTMWVLFGEIYESAVRIWLFLGNLRWTFGCLAFGTNSKLKNCSITDTETDEKMLISGPDIVATAAIVDYELTMTKPLRLTADTGIDSLTHAIEAYVSKKANPFSDSVALSAMGHIAPFIRTACFEPSNKKARENMMLGATLAGMAFSNASVALVHGMSRPIGAFFHVP